MGVDYGIVAAVAVFYVLPSLLLYRLLPEVPDADEHRRHQGKRIKEELAWRESS
jgi:hypothetical protein